MNKKALGLIGLGAVAAVGGSLAYYNHTATLDNPLTTTHFGNELVEDFTPPSTDLYPGAKWDKKVGATNTGDYPVLVRIRMDESWTRIPETGKAGDPYITHNSTIDSAGFLGTESQFNNGVFNANQPDYDENDEFSGAEDGKWESGSTKDGTTVYKDLRDTDNKEDEGWYFKDGYWYWTKVLEPAAKEGETSNPKSVTTNLMESLQLANNIDMGLYHENEWYQFADDALTPQTIGKNGWLPVEKDEDGDLVVDGVKVADANEDGKTDIYDYVAALEAAGKGAKDGEKLFRKADVQLDDTDKGYADSSYNLKITAEFVQATPEAVAQAWQGVNIKDVTSIFEVTDANGNKTYSNTDPNAVTP